MSQSHRRIAVLLLVVTLLLGRPVPARAGSIPTGTQIVLIFVGVGLVGAGVGITIYHFAHTAPSLTGCTASASGALTLENESDHKSFTLIGDTAALNPGERVRVTGKKRKTNGASSFLVEKVRKDYGPCPVTHASGAADALPAAEPISSN